MCPNYWGACHCLHTCYTQVTQTQLSTDICLNPRTVFWGPFGPRRTKTRYIFVIGQAYLPLIFDISCQISYIFMDQKSEWALGSKRIPITGNVSNFGNGSRVNHWCQASLVLQVFTLFSKRSAHRFYPVLPMSPVHVKLSWEWYTNVDRWTL